MRVEKIIKLFRFWMIIGEV